MSKCKKQKKSCNNLAAIRSSLRKQAMIDEAFKRDLMHAVLHPGQLSLDGELFPVFKLEVSS